VQRSSESFGALAAALAKAQAAAGNTYFKTWQSVPQSLIKSIIADIRKRKGLNPDPPSADEFIDKE
jgi:elongation factor 2